MTLNKRRWHNLQSTHSHRQEFVTGTSKVQSYNQTDDLFPQSLATKEGLETEKVKKPSNLHNVSRLGNDIRVDVFSVMKQLKVYVIIKSAFKPRVREQSNFCQGPKNKHEVNRVFFLK